MSVSNAGGRSELLARAFDVAFEANDVSDAETITPTG